MRLILAFIVLVDSVEHTAIITALEKQGPEPVYVNIIKKIYNSST